MLRKAIMLNYINKEGQQLENWANRAKVEKRLHQRTQMILACLENKTGLVVAQELGVSSFTVAK